MQQTGQYKETWNKIPELTLLFWITKITATTLGETGGDLLAQACHEHWLTHKANKNMVGKDFCPLL